MFKCEPHLGAETVQRIKVGEITLQQRGKTRLSSILDNVDLIDLVIQNCEFTHTGYSVQYLILIL